MRLDEDEARVILREVRKLDPQADIYLFGSRTQDELSGGDIDLLVISSHLGFSDKITLLVEIKLAIGDQKIDLLIKKPEDKLKDPFIASILKNAVLLN